MQILLSQKEKTINILIERIQKVELAIKKIIFFFKIKFFLIIKLKSEYEDVMLNSQSQNNNTDNNIS